MIQSKTRNLSPIRKKKVNDNNLNNHDENTYFENINISGIFDYPNNIYNNTKNYISNLFTRKVNKKSTVHNLNPMRVGKKKVKFYIGNENEQINQNRNYEPNNLDNDSNYYNSNNKNIITKQINDKYPNTLRLSNKYHNSVSSRDYDMSLFDDYLDENDDLNKNLMDMFDYINNVFSNTTNCIYYSFKRIFD